MEVLVYLTPSPVFFAVGGSPIWNKYQSAKVGWLANPIPFVSRNILLIPEIQLKVRYTNESTINR